MSAPGEGPSGGGDGRGEGGDGGDDGRRRRGLQRFFAPRDTPPANPFLDEDNEDNDMEDMLGEQLLTSLMGASSREGGAALTSFLSAQSRAGGSGQSRAMNEFAGLMAGLMPGRPESGSDSFHLSRCSS